MIRVTNAVQRAGLAMLLGLAVTTCRNDATGPGRGYRASLSLAPVLPQQAANLAAFGLSIDSLRVVIVRPPADTVVDTTVAFAADQDSLSLALSLELEASSEVFDVALELRGGGFVLFSAAGSVEVKEGGAGSNEPLEISNFVYTGPGAGITTLVVSPVDSVIRMGDSLRFRVDALADGVPVTQFYVAWSTTDETLAPINSHGVLTAPAQRGGVTVTATSPTGVTGSVPVTFVPVPTAIAAVLPIPQNVPPATAIGPLRARVLAADGLGVKGIPVTFQAVSGGGSVSDAIVVTDSGGFAQTPATSGTGVLSVFSATVAGVATPALFNVSVLASPATQLVFAFPPAGGVVDMPLGAVIEVHDAQGNVVANAAAPVTVALGANPGGATLSGTLTVNAVQGVAVFADLTIDQPGTGYTLGATAPGLTPDTTPPFDVIPGFTAKLWTNPAGGMWSNPANWSGGVVPGVTDMVYIALDGDYTVTLDVDVTVAHLLVGSGVGTPTLAISNHILGIDSGAVFSLQSALNLANATINAAEGGSVVSAGLIAVAPGTSRINGSMFLNSGGVLRLDGNNGPAVLVNDGELLNLGTIELTGTSWGGQLGVTTGSLLNGPGAMLRVVNGVGSSYTGTFDNQGSVQVDGPWTLAGASANHVNIGSIVLGAGDWTLNQTGTAPSFMTAGAVTVGVGRTWNVSGGTVDYANATPGGLGGRGTIALNGVALNLTPDLTHDTLALSLTNATVHGPGTLIVAGLNPLSITSSTLNAAVTNRGTVLVNPGTNAFNGALSNQSGALLRLLGNNGPAVVTVANGFTNQGTIELTGTSWGGQLGVTAGTLVNTAGATLRALNGAGNSFSGTLNNQGTVAVNGPWTVTGAAADHVNSGTIALGSGDWTLNQTGVTPTFTTTGTVTVALGRTWNVNGGAVTYQAGTLGGKGIVALSGVTLGLGTGLTHDTLALSLTNTTVNGPGILTVAGQATLGLTSTTLNAGIVNQGTVQLNPGTNSFTGTVTNQNGALLRLLGNNGPAVVTVTNGFTNQGTIELTGTSWGGQLAVTNGTLVNAVGAALRVVTGVGNSYSGALSNQGTVQVNGPWTLAGASAQHLNSGTIALGTGDWTLSQTGTAPTFTTTGIITIGVGRTWNVSGGTVTYQAGALGGRGVVALSAVTLGLGVSLTHDTLALSLANSTVNGPGVLTVAGLTPLALTATTVKAPLVNQGTLQVNPGTSGFTGTVANQSGALLRLFGNNGPAMVTVDNGFTNQGTIELTGTSWGGQLSVTNGTLTNTAGGTLAVLAGGGGVNTLDALVDNQGVVTIAGPLNLNQSLSNSGTVDWSDGSVAVKSGATLDILARATFNVSSQGQWTGSGGQAFVEIRFEGTMKVSTVGATAIGPLLVLNNAGTVDLQAPAVLKVTGDFNNLAETGELIGTGTLDVGNSPKVTNTGTVKPGGDAPGILTIVAPPGGWPQGSGTTLVMQIFGPAPGTGHDQLVVSGPLVTGGSLQLVGNGVYQPRTVLLTLATYGSQVGQTFSVGLFGGLTGLLAINYSLTDLQMAF